MKFDVDTSSEIKSTFQVDFVEKSTCVSKCFYLAGEEGFEPSAYGFGDRRSTS